jgi:hypothetical protein
MEQKSDAWLDGWFAHRAESNDGYETMNPYEERHNLRSRDQWFDGYVARHDFVTHGAGPNYDEV